MTERPEIVVIGSLNADLVQQVDRLPKLGETIPGGDLQTFSGGKGANQAYAAGRMGARARMIGQVGSDNLAALLLDSLRSAGVATESVGVADGATGTAVIFVLPDGENVIVIAPGANATLSPDLAAQRLRSLGRGSYLLSQLEIPIETVAASLAAAKQRGATTILDPAPARPLDAGVLQHVDYLTPNETETLALLGETGASLESDAEIERAALRIRGLGPKNVVLKLGARGCVVVADGACSPVPGFAVQAVDTTGAGDVFNGAFATALAEGRTAMQAARFANAAAALAVMGPGAQSSVPAREEVDRFLSEASA